MSRAPTPEQDLVETLRAAAADRVERTSLRQAAREIGLSPSGLQKFIGGTRPYRNTARKLEAWYALRAKRDGGDHSPETIAVAVCLLAGLLPGDTRAAFVADILSRVEGSLPADRRWRSEFDHFMCASI